MEQILELAVAVLIGLFVGAFLGAYMKKKGENLATHEDIDKLVAQVSAVTHTTKQIESKISNEVWQRQQRWELTKNAAFAVARAVGGMQDALTAFYSAKATLHKETDEQKKAFLVPHVSEALDGWSKASITADVAAVEAELACSEKVVHAFRSATIEMRLTSQHVIHNEFKNYSERLPKVVAATTATINTVRKELGIDEPIIANAKPIPSEKAEPHL